MGLGLLNVSEKNVVLKLTEFTILV
jgi:hypothetical protein